VSARVALPAVASAACFGLIAAVVEDRSTWVALVVAGLAALAIVKLTTHAEPMDQGVRHAVAFLIAAVALGDGIASWLGGEPWSDWSLGRWSLALGVLLFASAARDWLRWRSVQR
jgi:predicted MFS family arabinose efflux permease